MEAKPCWSHNVVWHRVAVQPAELAGWRGSGSLLLMAKLRFDASWDRPSIVLASVSSWPREQFLDVQRKCSRMWVKDICILGCRPCHRYDSDLLQLGSALRQQAS